MTTKFDPNAPKTPWPASVSPEHIREIETDLDEYQQDLTDALAESSRKKAGRKQAPKP